MLKIINKFFVGIVWPIVVGEQHWQTHCHLKYKYFSFISRCGEGDFDNAFNKAFNTHKVFPFFYNEIFRA